MCKNQFQFHVQIYLVFGFFLAIINFLNTLRNAKQLTQRTNFALSNGNRCLLHHQDSNLPFYNSFLTCLVFLNIEIILVQMIIINKIFLVSVRFYLFLFLFISLIFFCLFVWTVFLSSQRIIQCNEVVLSCVWHLFYSFPPINFLKYFSSWQNFS